MCSIAAAHNTPRAVVGKAISNMKTHNFHGIPTNSSRSIGIPHQIAIFSRRWAKVRFLPVLEMVKGSLINTLLIRHSRGCHRSLAIGDLGKLLAHPAVRALGLRVVVQQTEDV